MAKRRRTLSRLASALRGGHATEPSRALGPRPAEPLLLYEYESCPMCRRVREALTDLALDVEVRPCPVGGHRFRDAARAMIGRGRFPYLIDPNTGAAMTESAAIVAYLYRHYGTTPPPPWLFGPRFAVSSQLASFARGLAGFIARASEVPDLRLELDGFENDPNARCVREALCTLELPYLRRPGSLRFFDPNLERELRDVEAILAHLQRHYAAVTVSTTQG